MCPRMPAISDLIRRASTALSLQFLAASSSWDVSCCVAVDFSSVQSSISFMRHCLFLFLFDGEFYWFLPNAECCAFLLAEFLGTVVANRHLSYWDLQSNFPTFSYQLSNPKHFYDLDARFEMKKFSTSMWELFFSRTRYSSTTIAIWFSISSTTPSSIWCFSSVKIDKWKIKNQPTRMKVWSQYCKELDIPLLIHKAVPYTTLRTSLS